MRSRGVCEVAGGDVSEAGGWGEGAVDELINGQIDWGRFSKNPGIVPGISF